jgi:hypothetical protein
VNVNQYFDDITVKKVKSEKEAWNRINWRVESRGKPL